MENKECIHLKKLSPTNKYIEKKDKYENKKHRIICDICNCFMEYDKI